jgi:hypothetical protein
VEHDRNTQLVREEHLSQVGFRVSVLKNAATAQNQEIELWDLRADILSGQRPGRYGALDLVPGKRVLLEPTSVPDHDGPARR